MTNTENLNTEELNSLNLDKFFENKDVEWVKLSEIVTFKRGKRITKKDLIEDGKYPVIHGGNGFLGYINDYNKSGYTVVVVREGSCGSIHFMNENFWLSDSCYEVIPKQEELTKHSYEENVFKKFIYYLLKFNEQYLKGKAQGGSIKILQEQFLSNIKVPLLNSNDLDKLVKILDKQVDLLNNIKDYLTANDKQYFYYLQSLQNKFIENKHVKLVKLSEIVTFQRGQRIKKSELTDDGKYPAINGGKNIMGYTNKFNKERNSVIIVREGSCGFSYFMTEDFWLGDCCYDVNPKGGILEKYCYNKTTFKKFIFYIFQIYQKKLQSKIHGTIFAKLSDIIIGKLQVPLLSSNDLEKFVEVLDKFTDLKDNITQKLEARTKQYEYYRREIINYFKPAE